MDAAGDDAVKALAALALATVVIGAGAARADEPAGACATPLADPVTLPWRDTGFDGGRSACPRPGAGVVVDGHALIDTPGFYGTLGADATISLRLADGPLEWLVLARVPTVTFVQNAVFKATDVGYGPVALGVTRGGDRRWRGRALRLAVATRLDLPFTERRLSSNRVGGQVAVLATWRAAAAWQLHGRIALLAARTWSELGADDRMAGALGVDVGRRVAGRRLVVGGGLDAQVGWYGLGLDHLALRIGAQLRVTGTWRASLALGRPLVGADGTDLGFALGVSRDLP